MASVILHLATPLLSLARMGAIESDVFCNATLTPQNVTDGMTYPVRRSNFFPLFSSAYITQCSSTLPSTATKTALAKP